MVPWFLELAEPDPIECLVLDRMTMQVAPALTDVKSQTPQPVDRLIDQTQTNSFRIVGRTTTTTKGVCNPTAYTDGSHYSTRRLNGAADAVIARLFSEYDGPLRTSNVSDAAFKVVPYPHSSNAACPRADGSFDVLRRDTDWLSRPDHLFLFAPPGNARLTVEEFGEGHDRLGNIVVPYVK